jgi:hypothetical protein
MEATTTTTNPSPESNLQITLTSVRSADAFGNKIAGKLPPKLVIASKRNGAYADDIQLSRWVVMSCLKVESYCRKQNPAIPHQIGRDGRKKNYG